MAVDEHIERAFGAVADRGHELVVALFHLPLGSDDSGE